MSLEKSTRSCLPPLGRMVLILPSASEELWLIWRFGGAFPCLYLSRENHTLLRPPFPFCPKKVKIYPKNNRSLSCLPHGRCWGEYLETYKYSILCECQVASARWYFVLKGTCQGGLVRFHPHFIDEGNEAYIGEMTHWDSHSFHFLHSVLTHSAVVQL